MFQPYYAPKAAAAITTKFDGWRTEEEAGGSVPPRRIKASAMPSPTIGPRPHTSLLVPTREMRFSQNPVFSTGWPLGPSRHLLASFS